MSFAARLAGNLFVVGVRRWRRGPHHPEWGLLLEATVETLRHEGERQLAGTVAAWRANQEATAKRAPGARGVTTRVHTLAGRPALLLSPRAGHERPGTLLYLHGGGYVTGSPRTHQAMVSHLVAASGVRAILLDYRLAPEHPFPAAVDDAVAAVRALYHEGVAPAQLALAGDSSGGGLCLAAMSVLRDDAQPLPACAALLSPWVDLEGALPSVVENVAHDWGDRRTLDVYAAHYAKGRLREPLASPLHASLAALPALLIQFGGSELLRDECRQLAANARRDGVEVEAREWPGMVHAFQLFAPIVPQSNAAIAELAAFLDRHLSPAA